MAQHMPVPYLSWYLGHLTVQPTLMLICDLIWLFILTQPLVRLLSIFSESTTSGKEQNSYWAYECYMPKWVQCQPPLDRIQWVCQRKLTNQIQCNKTGFVCSSAKPTPTPECSRCVRLGGWGSGSPMSTVSASEHSGASGDSLDIPSCPLWSQAPVDFAEFTQFANPPQLICSNLPIGCARACNRLGLHFTSKFATVTFPYIWPTFEIKKAIYFSSLVSLHHPSQ